MEEEQREKAIDTKCPRKLDYNAPLLSTRRPSGGAAGLQFSRTSSQATWRDASGRVPFSWEQSPGKPKDLETSQITDDVSVPPPKLPPGRWHPPKETIKIHDDGDEGRDGEIDDDDFFSDAIDMFSLSESMDMIEISNRVDGLGIVNSEVEECSMAPSPSFIIRRFLPDANALAASSALAISKNLNKKQLPQSRIYREGGYVSQAVRLPYSSSKGCGFDIFFPWRMKHRPCGLKSPVRQPSLNAKPQSSARRKQKH